MDEPGNADEGFSDNEVVYEDDGLEVVELDEEALEHEGPLEDMEDLGLEEEEEAMAVRNDAMTVFRGHTGSVFSVSLHPQGNLVCSGGEDDRGFLWRASDATVLMECSGHKDSVTCTRFSSDGRYLATGDMGGVVKVWAVEERQPVCTFEVSDLEWLRWHPIAHVLLAGTSDGGGWLWRVPSGECKTFQAQNCKNVCSAILPDGKHICCGYEDGGVRVWNLKDCTTVATVSPMHAGPVNDVAAHSDGTLLLSGSVDSMARLINSATGKVVATFQAGLESEPGGNTSPSVEAVAFSPSLPVALTASLSGGVGVWDLTTQKLRHKLSHQTGVTHLCCSRVSPLLFTSCLDGAVRLWDLRGGQCTREWWGHTDDILCIDTASNDGVIITGSDDKTVQVFSNT